MGVVAGWERALFFKPSPDFVDEHSFWYTPTKEVVASEVANVQNNVGMMEVSGFNRIKVSGPKAAEWLDGLTPSRTPKAQGKVSLIYTLTEHGDVLSEATIANLGNDTFWWGSAAAAEDHDWDWLQANLPDEGVSLEKLIHTHTILVVAGPKSADLLSKAAPRTDWSAPAFRWLTAQKVHIGHAAVIAMKVSFSGE